MEMLNQRRLLRRKQI